MDCSGSIAQFLEGRTLLVTGATGFLAKVFVEKILRSQPKVRKLYLLMRARDTKRAQERFQNEIINKELFRVLRETQGTNFHHFINSKVKPIPGDISYEDLAIKDPNLKEELWKEVEVAVNFAATTSFKERYDIALDTNTFGALRTYNFAKRCAKIKLFLHVSTAYVCGERGGLLLEKPFRMGETLEGNCELDIDEENKIMEQKLEELRLHENTEKEITLALKDFGLKRAKLYGWPNPYVFTKAMGEMLLQQFQGDIPMAIIRPTMITSTFEEPFPGWIEGLRTIDSVIAGYGKGRLTCFIGNPSQVFDLIPVDMVANVMLVAMARHANKCDEKNIIYHVGSSSRNPIQLSSLHDFIYRFFVKNPLINKKGEAIKVPKGTVLSTRNKFLLFMAIRYILPLKGLQVVNMISFWHYDNMYKALEHKINLTMQLAKLYEPYVFFKGIFDDANLENLRMEARENLKDSFQFSFDPKSIDWEDYIMNIHIPGLIEYVLK